VKKYLLFALVVILLFFGCAVNREETRVMTVTLQSVLGTFELSSGIRGKLVTWKEFKDATKWYEEALPSVIWPIYPAESIGEDMIGRKLRVTYQIKETLPGMVEQVLAICMKRVEILK